MRICVQGQVQAFILEFSVGLPFLRCCLDEDDLGVVVVKRGWDELIVPGWGSVGSTGSGAPR